MLRQAHCSLWLHPLWLQYLLRLYSLWLQYEYLLRLHSLRQARLEFAAVRAQLLEQAPAQLRLPRPVPFEVSVRDVRLSPAQLGGLQPGGPQPGGGGFAPCIAFGEERCFGASVELEASDLAVDEIDIELWDGAPSRHARYTPKAWV